MIVERERFTKAILTAMADTEMLRIMEYATDESRSVNDVIRKTGISHSTAYRKIKYMLEESILFTEKIAITDDGKRYSLIRSTLKSINVRYERGKTMIEVDYNVNRLERTAERIFSLGPD